MKDAAPSIDHRRTVVRPAADGQLARRITEYISNLAKRNESGGAAQSAWWTSEPPELLQKLMTVPVDAFEKAARAAVGPLAGETPPTARSGLVVLARSVEGDAASIVALKLELSEEQLARFDDDAIGDDAIVEERIPNVLPKPADVKKGALFPHPDATADARVVDEQLRDPAGYWLRWMGLTARPKEPALAKLAVGTVRQVLTELSSPDTAGKAVAAAVGAQATATEPVSVRAFSDAAAKAAKLDEGTVWAAVTHQDPALAADRLSVGPRTFERIELVISLGDGVVVRGPASALAGRYTIRQRGGRWATEVTSTQRPEVKEEVKRGAPRRQ